MENLKSEVPKKAIPLMMRGEITEKDFEPLLSYMSEEELNKLKHEILQLAKHPPTLDDIRWTFRNVRDALTRKYGYPENEERLEVAYNFLKSVDLYECARVFGFLQHPALLLPICTGKEMDKLRISMKRGRYE